MLIGRRGHGAGAMTVLDRFRLDDRKALVTGASRGIGQAIALAFAEAGADVALGARTLDALGDTIPSIEKTGRRAVPAPADMRDLDTVTASVRTAAEQLGGLDILVNNAGVSVAPDFEHMSPEQADEVFEVNLRAPMFAARAAIPYLRESEHAVVMNISSIAAVRGGTMYGPSKGALETFTRSMAMSWGPFGIRVVAIAPGVIATDMTAPGLSDREQVKVAEDETFLGRIGAPEDIASVAVFLASDAASFITDEIVSVSGGGRL